MRDRADAVLWIKSQMARLGLTYEHLLAAGCFAAPGMAGGKKVSVERLSEESGIHRQTAPKHSERLALLLRGRKGVNGEIGEQAKAMQYVDELLRDRGFVGMEEAA
ncbi:hypothetical protein PO002_24185 [Cupriavidus necator]|uniref:hypothetical protein n=1 Tax=Cupriavidus necator TaxID=106590 RepID=UPI0039C2D3FB